MKEDIVDKLMNLHKQATTERSHYYVGSVCKEAIVEISRLRLAITILMRKGSPTDGEGLRPAAEVIDLKVKRARRT